MQNFGKDANRFRIPFRTALLSWGMVLGRMRVFYPLSRGGYFCCCIERQVWMRVRYVARRSYWKRNHLWTFAEFGKYADACRIRLRASLLSSGAFWNVSGDFPLQCIRIFRGAVFLLYPDLTAALLEYRFIARIANFGVTRRQTVS